jgi:hypothetical protein
MSDPRDRFDDPDAPPSEEERAAAEDLRAALEGARPANDDAALAGALRAAYAPKDLAPDAHRAIVARAIDGGARGAGAAGASRGRVVRVSFGAGAVLALAASVALALYRDPSPAPTMSAGAVPGIPLALSRSTQELFDAPFARAGGETSRIDRIAMARGADLRDNEFARWGVR